MRKRREALIRNFLSDSSEDEGEEKEGAIKWDKDVTMDILLVTVTGGGQKMVKCRALIKTGGKT